MGRYQFSLFIQGVPICILAEIIQQQQLATDQPLHFSVGWFHEKTSVKIKHFSTLLFKG